MSGKYIYYYEKHNRQGSSLCKSVEEALERAWSDMATSRAYPVRIEYLDGSVIFNTNAILATLSERAEENDG